MTALIDADSIIYIMAWNYREAGIEARFEVARSCDNFIKEMLVLLGAETYLGAFSPPSDRTRRSEWYKYARYKGNRPEKSDAVKLWEPVIKEYLGRHYGFVTHGDLEADDVIAGVAYILFEKDKPYVICSPDKDLDQIAGLHYDYRGKAASDTPIGDVKTITLDEAYWNFWMQMLTGDENDNVAGVPKIGPVKARKLITELQDNHPREYTPSFIKEQYCQYFGYHYGPIIFNETLLTLKLLTAGHSYWYVYEEEFRKYASTAIKELAPPIQPGLFDLST